MPPDDQTDSPVYKTKNALVDSPPEAHRGNTTANCTWTPVVPIVFASSPVSLPRDRTWHASLPLVFAKPVSSSSSTRKKQITDAHQVQGSTNTATNSRTSLRSSGTALGSHENITSNLSEDHNQGLMERTVTLLHVHQTIVDGSLDPLIEPEEATLLPTDDGKVERGHSKTISAGFTSSRSLQRPFVPAMSTGSGGTVNNEVSEGEEEQETSTDHESKPSTYKIPEDVLRRALLASRSSAAAFWSYKMYQGPNGEKVRLQYCTSKQTGETVAQQFAMEKILGFDLEWRPNAKESDGIKANVSLIQLACEDRIALFHLAVFKGQTPEEILPPTLRKIIESPDILKCGVAIRGDCRRIKTHLGVEGRGLFELSHLYNLVKYSVSNPALVTKRLTALAKQVEDFLQLPLDKGPVRTSDWSKKLDHEQTAYAATDAYASFRLFGALEAKRLALDPVPDRPAFAEEEKPILFPNVSKVQSSGDASEEDTTEVTELESADEKETTSSESQDESYSSLAVSDSEDFPVGQQIHQHLGSSKNTERRAVKLSEFKTGFQPPTNTHEQGPYDCSEVADGGQRAREYALNQENLWIKPPELIRAESWVIDWKNKKASRADEPYKAKAKSSALRAYAMWHDQALDVNRIASLMREKPLQKSTVSTYILDCILLERLPYDGSRAKSLFDDIPWAVRSRYDSIRRRMP